MSQHFWTPEIDPAHPMDCTQPERYVLQRLGADRFLATAGSDEHLEEVESAADAYQFHTQEAAVRAAQTINAMGQGPFDVVKVV
ncbi:MAG: hypothetical protein ACOYMY_04580 [Prochlorococcaceae cyanobacterium]|jgi:hypothetical protein